MHGSKEKEAANEAMLIGSRVKIYSLIHEEGKKHKGRMTVCTKMWTVERRYPRFVLMVDKHGIRECFSYWYLRRHMKPPKCARRPGGGTKWEWEY